MAVTLALTAGLTGAAAAATIQFQFDASFDDATPVTPLPGNAGTTLGEQRRILFQAAGQIWADIIQSPVPIVIEAGFTDLQCDAGGAVLGSAGPTSLSTNSGLMGGAVFYPRTLEDALTGSNQDPSESDIQANFNANLDAGSCPGFNGFYYGLDNNAPAGQSALFSTVLHEIAHGLGFTSLIGPDGELPMSGSTVIPSVFDLFLFDVDDGSLLVDFDDDADRADSILDDPNLVWIGDNVTNALPGLVSSGINSGRLRMYAPGGFEPGSSVSHFSTAASPNLLMEPFLTPDLMVGDTDVTPFLFQDMGYVIVPPVADRVFESSFEAGE